MAQNKKLNIQPVALTTGAVNYLNCAITSLAGPIGFTMTQPYLLIRHIRAVNYSATPTTVSMFKGLTGGSTNATTYAWNLTPIAGNSSIDWYGEMRLDSGDFLTALAGAATVVLNFDSAEIGIA